MIFYKTSTSGNDFIIVDRGEVENAEKDPGEFAREICDRDHGAGGDGAVYYRARENLTDFCIYNSDGSSAEISGNGMAGLSAVLFSIDTGIKNLTLSTSAGIRNIQLVDKNHSDFRLIVDMGVPVFDNLDHFPFIIPGKNEYEFEGTFFHPVSTGNPHAVVILKEPVPGISDLISTGRKLESAPIFPQRTNVEFVLPFDVQHEDRVPSIDAVFYERGAGITPFSSTGSTAVFSVMRKLGLAGDNILINTDKGPVRISGNGSVKIESATRIVYKGDYLSIK